VDLAHGTGTAECKAFPIALNLGTDCYAKAKEVSENALTRLEEWKAVSVSTDFDKQ
jgi:hypothetical protein